MSRLHNSGESVFGVRISAMLVFVTDDYDEDAWPSSLRPRSLRVAALWRSQCRAAARSMLSCVAFVAPGQGRNLPSAFCRRVSAHVRRCASTATWAWRGCCCATTCCGCCWCCVTSAAARSARSRLTSSRARSTT
eukprot:4335976-Pleurochrysis_carterae.AAC.2